MSRGIRIDLRAMSPASAAALRATLARQNIHIAPSRSGRSSGEDVDFEAMLAFSLTFGGRGIPKATRQFQFVPNRKVTADFAWPEFRVIVEVQGGIWRRGGGAHSHPNNILRDIEKQQLAMLHGWWIFPVTTDEVQNGQALKLIELALQSKGWKP
jgi:very-short-patch-repair endonuclease